MDSGGDHPLEGSQSCGLDGKIKRTSFARRFAPEVFVCTLFLSQAEQSKRRSPAALFLIVISFQRAERRRARTGVDEPAVATP